METSTVTKITFIAFKEEKCSQLNAHTHVLKRDVSGLASQNGQLAGKLDSKKRMYTVHTDIVI